MHTMFEKDERTIRLCRMEKICGIG
jgi:hypothetical protein